MTTVSFSSCWKWVVLPQALKKMGNATPYADKKWVASNNHETHTYMYVTMNRCDNLYTKILYSKHCLHWVKYSSNFRNWTKCQFSRSTTRIGFVLANF